MLRAARACVQAHAAATRIPAHARLLDNSGAPTNALLEFCRETGVSLDSIFRKPPADIDFDAARDRLAALCRRTGADPPAWADDVGGADIDVLARLVTEQGASVDWLCYGTGPEPWSALRLNAKTRREVRKGLRPRLGWPPDGRRRPRRHGGHPGPGLHRRHDPRGDGGQRRTGWTRAPHQAALLPAAPRSRATPRHGWARQPDRHRSRDLAGHGGILGTEVSAVLAGMPGARRVVNHALGLGGRDIPETVYPALVAAVQDADAPAFSVFDADMDKLAPEDR